MNVVKFPGFGLEFNISRYLINTKNIVIYKYAVCIVLGIVLGLILSKISKEKFEIEYEYVLDLVIWGIIFGVIGARLYYVIFNLQDFLNSPSKILYLRDGGLAIYGGIIAIILFVYLKCKRNKVDFFDVCDYLVPYLALGQSIGRWGNFFNLEAYGTNTQSIFRMGIETLDGYIEVHPVFFYEALCTFILFIILKNMQKSRMFKGQILYIYFIFYGFVRMILEPLRIDSLMLFDIKISWLVSLIIFVIFSIIYVKNILKLHK